jgi:NADH dehydrogenase/NADH:ubiquinone oxidoreductase subunit G
LLQLSKEKSKPKKRQSNKVKKEKPMIKIEVDGKTLFVETETPLLKTCLENGIYIPNLCYLEGSDEHSPSSCRLCFVEIDGINGPVTACNFKITKSISVKTNTESVRRLQRSAMRLLLSTHHVDCCHCQANKKCELQKISKFLTIGLKPGAHTLVLNKPVIDNSNPFLIHFPNRCILCGKCIHACLKNNGKTYLSFAKRGIETVLSCYAIDNASLPCGNCLACIEICPVGALEEKMDFSSTG